MIFVVWVYDVISCQNGNVIILDLLPSIVGFYKVQKGLELDLIKDTGVRW